MKIYNYSALNGEFFGESEARKSPLEKDVFLIPAHATDIKPPVSDAGQVAVFAEDEWSLVDDDRGSDYWIGQNKYTKKDIGPLPDDAVTAEPPPLPLTQEQIDRNAKLAGVDFDGIMCSATAEDMWGLNSIKDWVRAGNDVNFEFSNGSVLEITQANIDAFESIWAPFRASFF